MKAFVAKTRDQHKDHAQAFNAAATRLSGKAQTAPDPVLLTVVNNAKPTLTGPGPVVDLAKELELTAASTYVANVGAYSDKNARSVAASIMGVEAQHLAILTAVGALVAAGAPELIALATRRRQAVPGARQLLEEGRRPHDHRQDRLMPAGHRAFGKRPREDSNLRTRLRRPMLYPLSYEGGGWRIPGRKPRTRADSRDLSRGLASVLGWSGARTVASSRDGGRAAVGTAGSCVRSSRAQAARLGAASAVTVQREPVDHERVAEEVEVLAGVADAVRAADPEDLPFLSRLRWVRMRGSSV